MNASGTDAFPGTPKPHPKEELSVTYCSYAEGSIPSSGSGRTGAHERLYSYPTNGTLVSINYPGALPRR